MKKLTYSLLTLATVEDNVMASAGLESSWVDEVAKDLNMRSITVKSHLKALNEEKVKEILKDENLKMLLQGTDAEKEQMLFALVGLNDAKRKKAFDVLQNIKEPNISSFDQILTIANLSNLPQIYLDNLKKSDLDFLNVICSTESPSLHQKIGTIIEILRISPLLTIDVLISLVSDANRAFMFSSAFDDASVKGFDANVNSLIWFLQKTEQDRQNLINFSVLGITSVSMNDTKKEGVLKNWQALIDGHYLDNLSLEESYKAYQWYIEADVSTQEAFSNMWGDASDLLDGISTWDEKLLGLDFYSRNIANSKILQSLGVLVGLSTWEEKQAYITQINNFGDTYHAFDGVEKGSASRDAFKWLTEHDEIFKALYEKTLFSDAKSWKLSFLDKKSITENMTKSAEKIHHAEVPVFANLDDDTSVADRLASIAKFFADYASIGEALRAGKYIDEQYATNGTDAYVFMQELMQLLGNDWEQEVKDLFPLSFNTITPSTAWVDFIDNYVTSDVFEATDTQKSRASILYSIWENRVFIKECGVKLLENITGAEIKNALAKIIGMDKDSFWDAYKSGILTGIDTFDAKLSIIDKVKKAKTDNVWGVLKSLLSTGSELLLSLDYINAQDIIDANADGFLLANEYSVIQTQITDYLEARREGVLDTLKMIRQNKADGILGLSDYHNYADHLKYKEAVFLFSDQDGSVRVLDLVTFYANLTTSVMGKLDAMVDADHKRKTVFLTYYACQEKYKSFFLNLSDIPSQQWEAFIGYEALSLGDKELFSNLYDQNIFSQAKTFQDIQILMDIYKSISMPDRVRLFRNLGQDLQELSYKEKNIHERFINAAHEYNTAGIMASSLLFSDDISTSDDGLSEEILIQDAGKARQMLEDYNFFSNNPIVRSLIVGLDEQQAQGIYWDLGAMAFDAHTPAQRKAFSISPFENQVYNLHTAKDALMLYALSSQMDTLLGFSSLFTNFNDAFGTSGYVIPKVDSFIEFFKKYTVTQALDANNGFFIPFFSDRTSDSFSLFLEKWNSFFNNQELKDFDYFMNYFDWYNTPTRLKVTVNGVSSRIINGQLDRLFKNQKWNYDNKSLMSSLNSPMDFIPEVINMLCSGRNGDIDVTRELSILNMIPDALLGQKLSNTTNIKHMVDTLKITMQEVEDYKNLLGNYGLLDDLVPVNSLSTHDKEVAKMIDLLYGNFMPTQENSQHVLKISQSGDQRAQSILSITPLWQELESSNMFDLLIPTVDPILIGVPTKAQVEAAQEHALLMEKIKLVNLLDQHKDRPRVYANVSQAQEDADIRAAKIWYVVPLDQALRENNLHIYVDNVAALENTLASHGVLPSDITANLPVDTDTMSLNDGLGEAQAERARKIELAIDLMPFYEKLADKKDFIAKFISLPFERSSFAYIKNLVSPEYITDDADQMFTYANTLLGLGTMYATSVDVQLAFKLGKYATSKLVKDLRDIGLTAVMLPDDLGEITQDHAMNIALQSFPEFRIDGENFASLSASLLVHGVTLSNLGDAYKFKTSALIGYSTYFKAFGNYILSVSAFVRKMGEHADADKIEQFMNAGIVPSDLDGIDMSLSGNRIALELTPFLSTTLSATFIHPSVPEIVLSDLEKQQIADELVNVVPCDIVAAKVLLGEKLLSIDILKTNQTFQERQLVINSYITKAQEYKTKLLNDGWFDKLDIDASCMEVESNHLLTTLVAFNLDIKPLINAQKENVALRALRFMLENTYASVQLIEGESIDINELMRQLDTVSLAQIYGIKDIMLPLLMANTHANVGERARYIKDLINLNEACDLTGIDKLWIADLAGKVSKDDLIALHKFMPNGSTAQDFIIEAAKYASGDLEPLMRGKTVSQYDWYFAHKDLFSALNQNHLFDELDGSPQDMTDLLTDQVWPSELTLSMNMGSLESVSERTSRIIASVLKANPDNISADVLETLMNVDSNLDRHDMLLGYALVDHVLFDEIHAKKLFSGLKKWTYIKAVYDNYKLAKDDGLIDILVKQSQEDYSDFTKENIGSLKGYAGLSSEDKALFKELATFSGKDYEGKDQNIFAYIYQWEVKQYYPSFQGYLNYYKLAKTEGVVGIFMGLINVDEMLNALDTYGFDYQWSDIKKDEHPKFIEAALTYKVFDGATHWWDSDYYIHDGIIQTFQGYKLLSQGDAEKLLDPLTPQASRDVLRSYLNAYYSYAKDKILSIPVSSIKEMQDLFIGYANDANSSLFNILYDQDLFNGLSQWSDISRVMDQYVKAGNGNQDRIKGLAIDLAHQTALLDGYTNDPNKGMFIHAYAGGMFEDFVAQLTSWNAIKIVLANFASMKMSAPSELAIMLTAPDSKTKREYVAACALAIQNNVFDKIFNAIDPMVGMQDALKKQIALWYDGKSSIVNAMHAAGFFDNMDALVIPYDGDWHNNYVRLVEKIEILASNNSIDPVLMITQVKEDVDTAIQENLSARFDRIEMAVYFYNSPLHKALFADVANDYEDIPYNLYANLSGSGSLFMEKKALLRALDGVVTSENVALIAKYMNVISEDGVSRANRIKALISAYTHATENDDVEALVLGNENSLERMNDAFIWYGVSQNRELFHLAKEKGIFSNLKNGVLQHPDKGIASEYISLIEMFKSSPSEELDITNAFNVNLSTLSGYSLEEPLTSFREMVVTQTDVDLGYIDVGGENVKIFQGGIHVMTAWIGGFRIPVDKTGNLHIELLKTFTGNGNPTLKATQAVLTPPVDINSEISQLSSMNNLPYQTASDRYAYIKQGVFENQQIQSLQDKLIAAGYTSNEVQNISQEESDLVIALQKSHFDANLTDGKTLKDLATNIFPLSEELDITNAFNVNISTLSGYSLEEPLTSFREIVVNQTDADRGYIDIGGENINLFQGGIHVMTAWIDGFQIPVHKAGSLHIELLKTFTGNGNPTFKATKAVLTINPGVPEITLQAIDSIQGLGVFKAETVSERVAYLQDLIEYNQAFIDNGLYEHLSDGSVATNEDRKLLCNLVMETLLPKPEKGSIDSLVNSVSSLLDIKKDGFNERGGDRALRLMWAIYLNDAASVLLSNMSGTNLDLIHELVKAQVLPISPVSSIAYVDVSAPEDAEHRAERIAMAMEVYGDGSNDLATGVAGLSMVNQLISEGVLPDDLHVIRVLLSFNSEDVNTRVATIKDSIVPYKNISQARWLNFNSGISEMTLMADKKAFLEYFGNSTDGQSRRTSYDLVKTSGLLNGVSTLSDLTSIINDYLPLIDWANLPNVMLQISSESVLNKKDMLAFFASKAAYYLNWGMNSVEEGKVRRDSYDALGTLFFTGATSAQIKSIIGNYMTIDNNDDMGMTIQLSTVTSMLSKISTDTIANKTDLLGYFADTTVANRYRDATMYVNIDTLISDLSSWLTIKPVIINAIALSNFLMMNNLWRGLSLASDKRDFLSFFNDSTSGASRRSVSQSLEMEMYGISWADAKVTIDNAITIPSVDLMALRTLSSLNHNMQSYINGYADDANKTSFKSAYDKGLFAPDMMMQISWSDISAALLDYAGLSTWSQRDSVLGAITQYESMGNGGAIGGMDIGIGQQKRTAMDELANSADLRLKYETKGDGNHSTWSAIKAYINS